MVELRRKGMWIRILPSGQEVSYDKLSFKELTALAHALDEWARLMRIRNHAPQRF